MRGGEYEKMDGWGNCFGAYALKSGGSLAPGLPPSFEKYHFPCDPTQRSRLESVLTPVRSFREAIDPKTTIAPPQKHSVSLAVA